MDVRLRDTTVSDLKFVLQIEHQEENVGFIGQWTQEQHEEVINSVSDMHFLLESLTGTPLGYLIVYDRREHNLGYYLKRINIANKEKGSGRKSLRLLQEKLGKTVPLTLAVVEDNARAIKAYLATGFEFLTLNQSQKNKFRSEVDDIPDSCLVMSYQ